GLARPALHLADRDVAVLHGERKGAGHERGAHARVLALGNAAEEDEPLAATAERAVKRPHPYLAGTRRGRRLGSDLGLAGAQIPERTRVLGASPCRLPHPVDCSPPPLAPLRRERVSLSPQNLYILSIAREEIRPSCSTAPNARHRTWRSPLSACRSPDARRCSSPSWPP